MPVQEPLGNTVSQSPASTPLVDPQTPTEARGTSPAFVAELAERVQQTRATIDSAAAAGDDDLAEAHLGELEGLLTLAADHDVVLPDTAAYLAEHVGRSARSSLDLTSADIPAQPCPTA